MRHYALGFAFHFDKQNVLLIKKNSTDPNQQWQNGKLNGLGGKLLTKEQDVSDWEIETVVAEDSMDAMIREFKEESGIETTPDDWRQFAFLSDTLQWDFCVDVFVTTIDLSAFIGSNESVYIAPNNEEVKIYNIHDFLNGYRDIDELVDPNVLSMLLHAHDPNIQMLKFEYKS